MCLSICTSLFQIYNFDRYSGAAGTTPGPPLLTLVAVMGAVRVVPEIDPRMGKFPPMEETAVATTGLNGHKVTMVVEVLGMTLAHVKHPAMVSGGTDSTSSGDVIRVLKRSCMVMLKIHPNNIPASTSKSTMISLLRRPVPAFPSPSAPSRVPP